ncbi:MAG: hypothetical protein HY012_07555, partial [Acidobacteria bacterium]|nr:hypothetical protein [Acidobacteriota bacterium]
IVSSADVLLALVFFFGGMNLALGVHSGYSLVNRFLGVGVLAFVVGLLLTVYAIAIKSRWKLLLRCMLYGVLLAVVSVALLQAARSQVAVLNSREQAVFALFWFVALFNVALVVAALRKSADSANPS